MSRGFAGLVHSGHFGHWEWKGLRGRSLSIYVEEQKGIPLDLEEDRRGREMLKHQTREVHPVPEPERRTSRGRDVACETAPFNSQRRRTPVKMELDYM